MVKSLTITSLLLLVSLSLSAPLEKRVAYTFYGDILFRIYSTNPFVDGTYITPLDEGNGSAVAFSTPIQSSITYNWTLTGQTEGIMITNTIPFTYAWIGPVNDDSDLQVLQFSTSERSELFSFDENNFLQYNGSYHWMTCHFIGDPNNYDKTSIAFQSGSIPANCEPAFIVKVPQFRTA